MKTNAIVGKIRHIQHQWDEKRNKYFWSQTTMTQFHIDDASKRIETYEKLTPKLSISEASVKQLRTAKNRIRDRIHDRASELQEAARRYLRDHPEFVEIISIPKPSSSSRPAPHQEQAVGGADNPGPVDNELSNPTPSPSPRAASGDTEADMVTKCGNLFSLALSFDEDIQLAINGSGELPGLMEDGIKWVSQFFVKRAELNRAEGITSSIRRDYQIADQAVRDWYYERSLNLRNTAERIDPNDKSAWSRVIGYQVHRR